MMYLIIPTEQLKEVYPHWEYCRKSNDGSQCIIHKEIIDELLNYASVLPLDEEEPINPYPFPLVSGEEINNMEEFKSPEDFK